MLRVLTRGIGGSSGLAMALTPVRPAYTRAAQTYVRHAVSMTSGCNSEESAGVRWQEQGLGREVNNVVQLMWIIKCFPPPHIHPGGERPFCSAGT